MRNIWGNARSFRCIYEEVVRRHFVFDLFKNLSRTVSVDFKTQLAKGFSLLFLYIRGSNCFVPNRTLVILATETAMFLKLWTFKNTSRRIWIQFYIRNFVLCRCDMWIIVWLFDPLCFEGVKSVFFYSLGYVVLNIYSFTLDSNNV